MNVNITDKLPHIGSSIFTVMSQLAVEHKAVNLGQGFPDYEMSMELVDLVSKAMRDGRNQYAHTAGLPALREQLAHKIFSIYGTGINADTDITVTPGGTYAIYTALTTILQPGDEVIVFEPAFDSYIPNIAINGAVPVLIPLIFPEYSIPWDIVKEKVNRRTKVIMINSPQNPTGAVLGAHDIEQLRAIVQDTGIVILSDEVYEHLIYDNLVHQSILRYPDLLQRSYVCFSFGKTYHCTGWKLGYCIAGTELMNAFRKVHQFNCFSCFAPAQVALAEYLQNEAAYLHLGSKMQQKRDFFAGLMQATAFEPLPSYGSYFQCYRYSAYSNEPDTEFAKRLITECGVVTIPVSAFYQNGKDDKVIRFCFAKKEETLRLAVDKITDMDHRMVNYG